MQKYFPKKMLISFEKSFESINFLIKVSQFLPAECKDIHNYFLDFFPLFNTCRKIFELSLVFFSTYLKICTVFNDFSKIYNIY